MAGGCCFIAKKSTDAADKADSFHFGAGKPADKAQGKADTLLEEHIFECDHGPEDFRDGSEQNAAGEKIHAAQQEVPGTELQGAVSPPDSCTVGAHPSRSGGMHQNRA